MLQIAEDATRIKQTVNLGIELAFPFVYQMMNREAGHDRIELAQRR